MTTSGTYTFSPDVADLCLEAWERCGKNPETMTGDVLRAARRSLMYMLQQWSTRGLNLWQVDQQTTTLTISVASLTLPAGTLDVLEAAIQVGALTYTMTPLSRDGYFNTPDKTTTGRPNQYWVDRILPLPVLYLYPVPDVGTYTLVYNRIRVPMDVSSSSQTLEVPPYWLEAAVANLAARLAQKFVPDRLPDLAMAAKDSFQAAVSETRERVALVIKPRMSR